MRRNLIVKIFSLILALILCAETFPVTSFAMEDEASEKGSAEAVTTYTARASASGSKEARANVEKQIRAYAKSINQSNADDEALWALAKHGVSKRGATLSVGESHALSATLMNAEMTIACLTDGCIAAFDLMQNKNIQTMYGVSGFDWGVSEPYYGTSYCSDLQDRANTGIGHSGSMPFEGSYNSYDESLEWMSGAVGIYLTYKQLSVNENSIVYEVTAQFKDRFDFHGDNGSVSKDILSLLGSVLFREFEWNATVRFQVEVPNSCDHTPGQYHLIYDPENKQLLSDSSNGFLSNPATAIPMEINEQPWNYYELAEKITLRHDRPWVLTYTVKNTNELAFSSTEKKNQGVPYLIDYHRAYLVVKVRDKDAEGAAFDHYYGLGISRYFNYNTKDTYTFRLHNVVNSDGSNMIYSTVYNHSKQQTVLEETPMNDYYLIQDGKWVLIDDNSNGVSGIDLSMQYLSNQSFRFGADLFEMTVWECGENSTSASYFTSRTTAPTCDSSGYTTHSCILCGYSYQDTYKAALGHKYGDWSTKTAPTCTSQGEETRKCSTCKKIETRAIQALGHDTVSHAGQPATCTESSWMAYETCSRCNYSSYQQIEAMGHEYASEVTAADCTTGGFTVFTCDCGDTYTGDNTEALGHDLGAWEILEPSTCTESGTMRRECSCCEYFELDIVEANGHDYHAEIRVPECTEQGFTTYTCACGHSYVDDYEDALGHDLGAWKVLDPSTCTEIGAMHRECSRCEYFETEIVEANGHNYHTEIKLPKCTEQGFTIYTCACGHSYLDDYEDALGHDLGAWVDVEKATCTEDGLQRRECSCCDNFEERSINALDHSYGAWYEVIAATSSREGEERRDCERCDQYESRAIVYKGNYLWLEGEDLLSQDTVWIDGSPYPVEVENGYRYVKLPTEETCTMVTYTYQVEDSDDVHMQYPTDMKVYIVADGKIEYIPELDNILQYSGTSIRIAGNKGIRMITSLTRNAKSALTGSGLAGYTLIEYGTALCWASDLKSGDALILGREYTRSNYAYKKGVADPVFATTKELTQYTNVLVGFSLDQCKDDIAMRPYIILEDGNGNQLTLYGGTIYRSIGYIAYQNRNVFQPGTASYNYVWEIIHHVYGNRYDTDYKG